MKLEYRIGADSIAAYYCGYLGFIRPDQTTTPLSYEWIVTDGGGCVLFRDHTSSLLVAEEMIINWIDQNASELTVN